EQQRRRPDRADDEVLQARLERPDQVDVDGREHVERDREPLEAEEQGHQVPCLDEERHPGTGGGEQRVVLGDVLVAHPLAVRDEDGDRTRPGEDHLRERSPPVAPHRVVDDCRRDRRAVVEECRQDARRDERTERDERARRPPRARGREHGHHQEHSSRTDQRKAGREREPVDVRRVDHLATSSVGSAWACPETRFGQAESPIRHRTSGTRIASSPTRRSSALSLTAGPTSWWSTAEIARSMYIAASTIAAAPITAQIQPCWNTPARMRNSPANVVESGTASEITPTIITTVASAGRPRAIPPSSAN